jgi:hypothetical protein
VVAPKTVQSLFMGWFVGDGGDEEVSPGVDGFVGGVDVEHGRVLCGGWHGDAAQYSDGPGCWFENECIAGRCGYETWLRMKP